MKFLWALRKLFMISSRWVRLDPMNCRASGRSAKVFAFRSDRKARKLEGLNYRPTTMTNISSIAIKTINGEDKKISDYAGNVLLIVNVASYCGYTKQYSGLEALNQKYAAQGLKVMAFPCNDFGAQEPDSNDKIATFCETRYGVTFDLFDKVKALGSGKHPLYAELTKTTPAGDIQWNFEKFLVNKQGEVIARYPSSATPDSLASAIEAELTK
jgi:glutathione peroxidase